jgi:hypothetical protein
MGIPPGTDRQKADDGLEYEWGYEAYQIERLILGFVSNAHNERRIRILFTGTRS